MHEGRESTCAVREHFLIKPGPLTHVANRPHPALDCLALWHVHS